MRTIKHGTFLKTQRQTLQQKGKKFRRTRGEKHKCQLIRGSNEMEMATESDNKPASMLQSLLYNHIFSGLAQIF